MRAGDLVARKLKENDVEAIIALLDTVYFSVNDPIFEHKRTALHRAAMLGFLGMTTALLERGADVNATDEFNMTPLYLAVNNGHNLLIPTLLKYRANLSIPTRWGQTPLLRATINNNAEAVEMLCKGGANPNQVSGLDKLTPLHWASTDGGNPGIANTLIRHGAHTTSVPEKLLIEEPKTTGESADESTAKSLFTQSYSSDILLGKGLGRGRYTPNAQLSNQR